LPLTDVDLLIGTTPLPRDVRSFLRDAQRRIERYRESCGVAAFVPSDYERAYHVLRALSAANLTPGNLFCEWGSGFGVVACLASLLDFDACGIEIEEELVELAQQLADDYGLPVEFSHGSFVPRAAHTALVAGREFSWLATEPASPRAEFQADDFDVIFAYPWPDEECLTATLFARYAAPGAVLVTYHGVEDFRVRRKTRLKS
jgi:hypothetical protein